MNAILDRVGMTASLFCSVHCALHGLLPVALALGFILGPVLEWTLVIVSVVLAVITGFMGLRVHGSTRVALPLFAFAVILLAGRFLEDVMPDGHAVFGAAAGIGLAMAHLQNLRACSAARKAD